VSVAVPQAQPRSESFGVLNKRHLTN